MDSLYPDVHRLCAVYRSRQEPNRTIRVGQDDIAYEKRKSVSQTADQPSPRSFSDGYLETRAVYRRLTDRLLSDDILLSHGSAVSVDGTGYLFTAKSGTLVYGTPWAGKHRLSSNIAVPLRSICPLERGEQNQILAISRQEAWPMLLQQSSRPGSSEKLKQTLCLIDKLMDKKVEAGSGI